ncbi:MAG: hypothetical protein M2R45_00778 [Verrucomicrobia subdivision 3 bacterium]|nr:hypothetical protein [Limisphaerales bacterium]MCS1413117.1 hypothetical protein [Limisphaerales bacterium]
MVTEGTGQEDFALIITEAFMESTGGNRGAIRGCIPFVRGFGAWCLGQPVGRRLRNCSLALLGQCACGDGGDPEQSAISCGYAGL